MLCLLFSKAVSSDVLNPFITIFCFLPEPDAWWAPLGSVWLQDPAHPVDRDRQLEVNAQVNVAEVEENGGRPCPGGAHYKNT